MGDDEDEGTTSQPNYSQQEDFPSYLKNKLKAKKQVRTVELEQYESLFRERFNPDAVQSYLKRSLDFSQNNEEGGN